MRHAPYKKREVRREIGVKSIACCSITGLDIQERENGYRLPETISETSK